ncbi:MAG: serine hydrolase, partial [Streptosporangiaceae bacterium]
LASGYAAAPGKDGQTAFRRYDVNETVVGDGGCVTSLADLAAWHGFIASGAVLGTGIRDGLFARQVLTDGTPTPYGLGVRSIDVADEEAWWHSGSWAGYRTAVIYLPGRGTGVTVLANRNDKYASHIAAAAATALVTGADVRTCYTSVTGIPASPQEARGAAADLAGLWHAPALDLYVEFQARDGELTAPDSEGDQAFRLGTDGRWHGVGTASGATFTRRGDVLAAGWGLSAGLEDSYVRAGSKSAAGSASGLPSGHFLNEELGVYATTRADDAGPEIAIGFAAPRKLAAAGPGAWRAPCGGALTVRLADDGSRLLISVPGSHHLAFIPVPDAGDVVIPRGLRAGS